MGSPAGPRGVIGVQFSPTLLNSVCELLGIQPTLQACKDSTTLGPLCPASLTTDQFLQNTPDAQCIFMQPPSTQRAEVLQHYMHLKRSSKGLTSALILLPATATADPTTLQHMRHFTLVAQYPARSYVYTNITGTSFSTPHPLDMWYDAPLLAPTARLGHTSPHIQRGLLPTQTTGYSLTTPTTTTGPNYPLAPTGHLLIPTLTYHLPLPYRLPPPYCHPTPHHPRQQARPPTAPTPPAPQNPAATPSPPPPNSS